MHGAASGIVHASAGAAAEMETFVIDNQDVITCNCNVQVRTEGCLRVGAGEAQLTVRSELLNVVAAIMSNKMFDIVFNLKFQAKELNRNATKCEKNEKLEKDKAFKAMQKNNMEGAQIHAANAIRLRNEQLQFLRIASQYGTSAKSCWSVLGMPLIRAERLSGAGVLHSMQ
jgi:hypothetical protein